jgi:type IV pilus assembly protein PilC
MEFRCRLGTATGEIVDGVYIADSEARLRHDLEEKGLHVLSLQPRGALGGLTGSLPQRRRVRQRDFLEFNQELATLLKAGMPLVQSLDLLRSGMTDPVLKSVVDDVHQRVKAGASLSEAFDEHEQLFTPVYTASLMAGERSGSLEMVLRRFVTHAKLLAGLRRKTISALIYPAVLMGLSVIVVGIIIVKMVPAFSEFYKSFDRELPLVTRLIVQVSDLVVSQFGPLLIAVIGGGAALYFWFRRARQRVRLDRAVLRLPGVGPIALKLATSQMARTLATLLGGGIPLVNALDVASRSVGNRFVAEELRIVARNVREGQSLAGTLRARGIFPDVAVKMTEVGESTGALQDMLNSLADFYDEEIETNLERFVTLIQPAVLIIMGIVIACLLLALYMPLFQLTSVVS